jgi:hypothetical protein
MTAAAPSRPEVTLAVSRGVVRTLFDRGFTPLLELTVATGRRIDVAGLGPAGEIIAVEVKSSVADFRADQKWQDYYEWCDKLYFAAASDFPHEILPRDPGLIVADQFGGEIIRETVARPLNPARRKAMTLRFARVAAERLLRAPLATPGAER